MKLGCDECGRQDQPLYRANAKGIPGIFKCKGCLGEENIEPELVELCEDLHDIGKEIEKDRKNTENSRQK